MTITRSSCLLLLLMINLPSQAFSDPTMTEEQPKLVPCSNKPNCVNSEYKDKTRYYLSPVKYPKKLSDDILNITKQLLIDMGGELVNEEQFIVHFTFTSSLFKFVDDVKIRVDTNSQYLHFRSASRVGYSDFGVNKKRMTQFKKLLINKLRGI